MVRGDNNESYTPVEARNNVEQFVTEEQDEDFKKKLRDHFRDYCSTTGIHGFSYLGQNRTLLEL